MQILHSISVIKSNRSIKDSDITKVETKWIIIESWNLIIERPEFIRNYWACKSSTIERSASFCFDKYLSDKDLEMHE